MSLRKIDHLPVAHTLLRTSDIDHPFNRAEYFLALESTEDVEGAVQRAGTWLLSGLVHLGHGLPELGLYVESLSDIAVDSANNEDVRVIKFGDGKASML